MAITHYDNDAAIPVPTRVGETISVGPNRVLYKCWVLDPPIYNILTIDHNDIYVPPAAADTAESGAALASTIVIRGTAGTVIRDTNGTGVPYVLDSTSYFRQVNTARTTDIMYEGTDTSGSVIHTKNIG